MTTAAWAQMEPALDALFRRIATVPGVVPSVSGSKSPSAVGQRGGPLKFPAPSNPTSLEWYIATVIPVGKTEVRQDYLPGTFDAEEGDTPVEIEGDTYEPDPEDPELRLGGVLVSVLTQTAWTIEFRIESGNQTKPAHDLARALVSRMRLDSVHDELEAIGLAYTGWDEITDDEYDDEHGRATSVFVGRLYFNGSEYAEDTPVTTIESSNVTANVSV